MSSGTAVLTLGVLLVVAGVTGGYLIPTALARRDGPPLVSGRSWALVALIGLLVTGWGAYLQVTADGTPSGQAAGPASSAPPPAATVPFTPPSTQEPAAITVTPTSGGISTKVVIRGRGFDPGEQVRIEFSTDTMTQLPADGTGHFTTGPVAIPNAGFWRHLPSSNVSITATGTSSLKWDSADFLLSGTQ